MKYIVSLFMIVFCFFSLYAEEVTLQLRWDNQFQFAGYYAALWQGYYDEAGIEVTIKSALEADGRILSATEEVSSGNADFGIGAADILIANDNGAGLMVSSVIFQESAAAFYSLADTRLYSARDLVDLKVARNPNDLIDIELQAMLRAEGIDPGRIDFRSHESGFKHLLNGEVDVMPGYSISFPFEMSTIGIKFNMLKPYSVGIDFYGDSLFTSADLVDKNPELVKNFTEASLKGWRYALENSLEIADKISGELPRNAELSDIYGFNRFQIEGVKKLTHIPYVSIGNMNPARWTAMNDHLKEIGIVKEDLHIDDFLFDLERYEVRKVEERNRLLSIIIPLLISILFISIVSILILRYLLKVKTESFSESEARYRNISESMPIFICRFDPDFNITYFNKAYGEYFGKEPDQLLGKSIFHDIAEMDQQMVKDSLRELSSDTPIIVIENRIINKDGNICWQRWTNRVLFDSKGRISEYQSIGEDITETKIKDRLQSEKLKILEYAENHSVQEILQKLLDVAESMTFSKIGFFHFINEEEGTVNLQTWSTSTLREYCKVDGPQEHYPISKGGIWLDSIKTREPVIHNDYESVQHKNGLPEGHAPLARELVVPVKQSGKIVAILGVGNKESYYNQADIDIVQSMADYIWATILRINVEEKLRESRNNLRITLNSIADGVIAVDSVKRIVKMNPVAEKITGWLIEEANGLPIEKVFNLIPAEWDSSDESPISKMFEKDLNSILNRTLDSRNGEHYEISSKCSPIKDEKGSISGFVIVFRDITEEKVLQEQLVHKSKMDAIGQLSGGIAHDFNNMLSGIINAVQLLKMPSRDLDEKALRYTDIIMQASTRATELINKLMAFSRKEELISRPVDLHAVIDETVSLLDKTINKNIKISKIKNSLNSKVFGDASSLQSVVMNVCINASHAMPDGGDLEILTKDVELSQSYCDMSPFEIEPGMYCDLEILDTGHGISQENLTKIFEPFFTTKEQGQGTGLGLSVVYGVIQAHKGEIKIYSEIGTGTAFHLLLPSTNESQVLNIVDEDVIRGSGTILLVDDEEILRIVGREMLEDLGYDVITAENGLEAIEIYASKSNEIDLVLIDMIMPEMDGKKTFYGLKEIDRDCKVLLLSGYTRNENLDVMKEHGLSGFLKKPFRIEELSKAIWEIK